MISSLVAVLAVAAYAGLGIAMYRSTRQEPEEEDAPDFEYLTVQEQLAKAQATSAQIAHMEQLRTDLAECTEDDVLVVHLEWVGRDDAQHMHELYCAGTDTASECLDEIAAREIHELKQTLSYECSVLQSRTRRRKNSRQNGALPKGEGTHDQELPAVWEDDFFG